MRVGQQAISLKEGRITRDGLIEQLGRLEIERLDICVKTSRQEDVLGPSVKVERSHVGSRRTLNRCLLARRKFRLQLIGNRFRYFALNCKTIGNVAIETLRPLLPVSARVDQLRVDAHFAAGSLDTAFEEMGG